MESIKLIRAKEQRWRRSGRINNQHLLIQKYEEDEAGQEDVGGADLPVYYPSGARCCSATVWAVPGFCLPLRHSVSFFFGLKTFNTLPSPLLPDSDSHPQHHHPHHPSLAQGDVPVNSLTRTVFALHCKKKRASALKSGKVSVRPSVYLSSVLSPPFSTRGHMDQTPEAFEVTFSFRGGVINSWQQDSTPYFITFNVFTLSDVFFSFFY